MSVIVAVLSSTVLGRTLGEEDQAPMRLLGVSELRRLGWGRQKATPKHDASRTRLPEEASSKMPPSMPSRCRLEACSARLRRWPASHALMGGARLDGRKKS